EVTRTSETPSLLRPARGRSPPPDRNVPQDGCLSNRTGRTYPPVACGYWSDWSPSTPHWVCSTAPVLESWTYHVPFVGRKTAKAALPSASWSRGTGTSPETPHWVCLTAPVLES